MGMGKYILDDQGNAVEEPDVLTWGRWMETADRHVGDDTFGDVRVSTVFLGIDHSFRPDAIPTLFETMIFGGDHNEYTERYATRTGAIDGHARAVAMVKGESATV